jgi:NitT/TauT family transport system ATP-binding protein
MTIFMVTHDIAEAFKLGTRLIVFDKVRHDPDFPNAYGATITYDLKLKNGGSSDAVRTAEFLANENLTASRASNVPETTSA